MWKRKIDNKMCSYGEIDYDKKVIRINTSKKKNKEKGDVIDTILHEEAHKNHPKMHEKNIRKLAKKLLKVKSQAEKQKLYSRYYK